MSSRDLIKALLSKEIPERMGVYEHFWPETLQSYWPEKDYQTTDKFEYYSGYDMVPCSIGVDSMVFLGRSEVLRETEEWQIVRDGRGASLKLWKGRSGTPEHVGFEITTPEKWKEHRDKLLGLNMDRLGDLDKARADLARARSRGQFVVINNLLFFEVMRATIGDEHFLPALLLEPDWIRDFCQVLLDLYRTHYEVFFREVGLPDGFWVYEDLGYTNSLFCSPRALAELIMPYEKAFVTFLKDYGLPVILHSCGDIREAIPQIIDAGFDCLQPMEAKAGCDVVEIARTYGSQLAYMGNIDVVALSTNDPGVVEAEIVPKLTKIREMRVPYIFHSDHSVPPTVRRDTYDHALRLFWENCAY